MQKSIIILLTAITLLGCKTKNENQHASTPTERISVSHIASISNSILHSDTCNLAAKEVEKEMVLTSTEQHNDLPQIHIEYKQKVNGYKVSVLWLSYCEVGEEAEMGQAIMHFVGDNRNDFYVYCPWYSDFHLYLNDYIIKERDKIVLDYINKNDEYLADLSPFYFSDMDFDGEDELVIANWHCGIKGGHSYDVFDIYPYEAIKKTLPPFDNIERYFTQFKPEEKTIINYRADVYSAEYLYYTLKPYDTFDENGEIVTKKDFILDKVECIEDNQKSVYKVIDGKFIKATEK